MFDRICTDNGIRHLLTAPYSPTTTEKVERLHKTMRAEFFTPKDRMFATVAELQRALDAWVSEYNTARPHQSCGGRPPIERWALLGSHLLVLRRLERHFRHGLMGSGGFRHVPASSYVPSRGGDSDAGSSYASGYLPCLRTATRRSGRAGRLS